MRRVILWPLLCWTVLWGLFFAPLLVGAARLPDGDFSGQFHAFALFQAREVAAGRFPLWSPGSYGGFPFAADTQAAVFYPPRWLSILLTLPWGFSYYALQLEAIAHVWLAGAFTYLLAYTITRERLAGLLAAVAFGLGGYLTSYPLLQLAILETIAWLPLVLLLLRRGVQRRRPLPWLPAAGVVLGISALAGHPQTFLHVGYMAAAYTLFLVWRARWRWPWLVGSGALVAVVAAGTAAVAWLPAVHYLAQTTRSDVTYEFVAQGFPLLDYLQILVPRALSLWAPQYVGMAAVGMAAVGLLYDGDGRRGTGDGRRETGEVVFWGVVVLAAAWISLGDKGILFELVYHVAPGFAFFRQQERLAGVVSLGLALLAAQGLALWLHLPAAGRQRLWRRLATVLAAGLLLVAVILLMARQIAAANWPQIWLRQVVVVGVVLVLLYDRGPGTGDWGWRSVPWRLMVLVLFLALDLTVSVGGAMNLRWESPTVFWPRPGWLEQLGTLEPARLDSGNLFHVNLGEVYGLEDVRGLSPLKPRVVERFEQLPRPRRWQLLNVTHVLAESPIEPGLTEITPVTDSVLPGEAAAARLYRFEAALPRAWMSYQPIVVASAERAFETLQDPGFDPATQVVLHTEVAGLEEVRAPVEAPQVRVSRPMANGLSIEVNTEAPGLLVISEWAYPGWQATVNGRPAPLHTADYALQALLLPAGRHSVALRFVPPGLAAGAAITVATLFLAAVLVWRWLPEVSLRQAVPAGAPIPGVASPGAENMPRIGKAPDFLIPGLSNPRDVFPRLLSISTPRRLITFLLLIAFGLRLYTSADQELRADEAFSVLFAARSGAAIVPDLIEVGETLAPFHYLALHGWMQVAGSSELALRYLSVVLSLLLLPLTYQMGRRLWDGKLGVLLLLLMATSPSLIWVGQDVRNVYAWTPVLAVAATLVLLAASAMRPWWPRWLLWALYAIIAALTVYSHYYGVFALLGHGLFLFFAPARRRFLLAWLGSGLVALLLFAPWPLLLWSRWTAAGHLASADAPELAQHLARIGRELVVGSTFDRPAGRWIFLGALVVTLYGAYRLQRGRPGWAAFLAGWLGSAALFTYLFRFQRALFNDYYISVAAPAWWALVAAGLLSLWRGDQWWQRFAGVAAIASLLIASALSLDNYYFRPGYNRSLGYRPIADQIGQQQKPGDIFLANAPDPSLTYYLADIALPRALQPARQGEPAAETEAGLAQLAAQYERIWFVPAAGGDWDKDGVALRWLDHNALLEWNLDYERLSLRAYRPLPAASQVLTPLELTLDSAIFLEGAFVASDGVPAPLAEAVTLRPGSAVNVTLVWQALAPVTESYTVFVHLLDENGVLVAQHDGIPVAGTRPTSTWVAGERLIDVHSLTVPAGATFRQGQLVAGIYRTESVERLRFDDGRDAVPVADVVLTP